MTIRIMLLKTYMVNNREDRQRVSAIKQHLKLRKSEEVNAETTVVALQKEKTSVLVSSVTLCHVGCGLNAAPKSRCRK